MTANRQPDIAENTRSLIQNSIARSNFVDNPAILTVSCGGMVLECNEISEKILDIPEQYPDGIHISMLFPQLQNIDLLEADGERVNPYLRFLSRIGRNFKVVSMTGRRFLGELFFSDITFQNRHQIIVMVYPVKQEDELY